MFEKKWRKTGQGVNFKKRNEYLSNLPNQNRSESGGSCAFWSVRTWNVLFVEFSGVELSFPSFLSAPPQAHTSTTPLPTLYQLRYQWLAPRSVYSISYYYLILLLIFLIVVVVAHYIANCTQIDWRWVSFMATFTYSSQHTVFVFLLLPIKAKLLVNNSRPRLPGRLLRYGILSLPSPSST